MRNAIVIFSLVLLSTLLINSEFHAQTTEFVYQGNLQVFGSPANGNYDFEFRVWDAAVNGTQHPTVVTRTGITIVNGKLALNLDFGNAFPGADRWLEIRVRTAGGGGYTIMDPRQKLTSSPYSVKSISSNNADQLGGVAANQYVITTDPRMTDARPPTSGSTSYIQNQNAAAQTSSNFRIDGTGTANIFTAQTQYNIGLNRVLAAPVLTNIFAGVGAGNVSAGVSNTFVGADAGLANNSGGSNTFVGASAGSANVTGSSNTALGSSANFSTNNLTNATVIGAGAVGSTSNSITLGRSNGLDKIVVPGLGTVGDAALCRNASNHVSTCSALSVPSGSANYIQNSTNAQASSNFNISGTGKAGIISASRYNLFDQRFMGMQGSGTIYLGSDAGISNTTGSHNNFFGELAGAANISGSDNSFFGFQAGMSNTVSGNSFFGYNAGMSNSAGNENAFFGWSAGKTNGSGSRNSYFGNNAGAANVGGDGNAFFGSRAGAANTSGSLNSFFGSGAGNSNIGGLANSFFGNNAGFMNLTGGSNTFAGAGAGFANNSGERNVFVGNGAGGQNAGGGFNTFLGEAAGAVNVGGSHNTILGQGATLNAANLNYATAIGSDALVSSSNSIVLGRPGGEDTVRIPGELALIGLGSAGVTQLCRSSAINGSRVSDCSSSLRYKVNINAFRSGLNLIKKLDPITFDWKDGGMHDVGLGAEDVAAIEPLLVTRNEKGEVEGVKYDRIAVVLINAVKEQQAEIKDQKRQIDALTIYICARDNVAPFCKEKK